MTSLLGTAGEDFASILNSLGYRLRRLPRRELPLASVSASEHGAVQTSPAAAAAETGAEGSVSVEAPLELGGSSAANPAAEASGELPVEGSVDASETTLNQEAAQAVEGVVADALNQRSPEAESAAVESATADLGAAPPPPAEPEYDEVWYPAGRNPRAPRNRAAKPAPHLRQGVPAGAAPAADGDKRHRRRDGGRRPPRTAEEQPQQEAGRANGKGKPYEGKAGRKERGPVPRPQRREPVFDPDSPFAALAVLRQPKSE
jgi:ATP-dependent RNA helicase SUPV3L1/SUV3